MVHVNPVVNYLKDGSRKHPSADFVCLASVDAVRPFSNAYIINSHSKGMQLNAVFISRGYLIGF